MSIKIEVTAFTSEETVKRSIVLSGQWATFVSSQRFNQGERLRFLEWLGVKGEPLVLLADGVQIYGYKWTRPRARGQRLNHTMRIPININAVSPIE